MTDLTRRSIGKNLRGMRLQRALSLEALAEQSGIPLNELKRLESGCHDFPIVYLFRLAPLLHFRASEIVEAEEVWRERRHKVYRVLLCGDVENECDAKESHVSDGLRNAQDKNPILPE